MVNEYQDAIKVSKIPRLNWKKILGISMNEYVRIWHEKGMDQEQIVFSIMKRCKLPQNKEFIFGWSWIDINKNVRIGVSARLAEIKIYQKGGQNESKTRNS